MPRPVAGELHCCRWWSSCATSRPEACLNLLCAFVEEELESAALRDYVDHLWCHLREQGGLLLLDGLDEVPAAEERRVQLKQVVEDFAAAFPDCRILVTSRTYAYQQQAWQLSGFEDVILAPFEERQIRHFVDRWYVVRDAKGEILLILPSLAEWLKVEDRARVRALLNRLAYEAHAKQRDLEGTADIPRDELVGGFLDIGQNPDVKPRRLEEYLSQRTGLLLPRGVGVYTFPHRTFQEYLAACYLTDAGYPEKVALLARDDPNRWREVALLAGAKSARGSDFALWALVEACVTGI